MKNIVFAFISLTITLLAGCRVVSYTDIETLQIPETIMPEEVKRAAVFTIAEKQDSIEGFNIKINDRTYPDTISTDSVAIFALFGLADALKIEHSLDTIFILEDYSPSFTGISSPKVSQYDLNQITGKYDLDYVIVLEEYSLKTMLEVYSIYDSNRSDLYLDVYPSYIFGLYNRLNGNEILKKYNDKYTYSKTSLIEKQMINFYSEREKIVKDIVYLTSYDFAKKLRPYWEEEERMYFVSGRYYLLLGVEEYRKGNFEAAVSAYQKAFDQGGNANKFKVAINMALAYEVKDDLPNAIKWAEIAFDRAKKPEDLDYAENYLSRVNKRWKDIQRFEKEAL